MGRPSEYSQEVVNVICERMQAGETLTSICKDDQLPAKNTVLRWLEAHTPFQTQYARARTALMDHYADQMVEIAFEGSNSDQVAVARDRLKVDTLKWIMSKIGHKKYGDKVALTGDADGDAIKVIQRIERVIVDAPAPARMSDDVPGRVLDVIRRRVPANDQKSAGDLLNEVLSVIDRALLEQYG